MTRPTPQGTTPPQYSPDGRWYWDGARWLPVPTAGSTEVTIWASQMRPGGLPAICVKTGQPADHWMRVSFRTVPPWTFLLLFLGAVPYLIVRLALGVRARGYLPVVKSVSHRLWAFWISGLVGLLLGVLLLVVGGSANSGAAAAVGGILVLAGIALVVTFRLQWIGPVVRRHDGYPADRVVVLRRVHPAFAQAVRAQQQAAVHQPVYYPPAGYAPQPAYYPASTNPTRTGGYQEPQWPQPQPPPGPHPPPDSSVG